MQRLNVLIIALALTTVMTVMVTPAQLSSFALVSTPSSQQLLAASTSLTSHALLWHVSHIAWGIEWNLKVDASYQRGGTLRQQGGGAKVIFSAIFYMCCSVMRERSV